MLCWCCASERHPRGSFASLVIVTADRVEQMFWIVFEGTMRVVVVVVESLDVAGVSALELLNMNLTRLAPDKDWLPCDKGVLELLVANECWLLSDSASISWPSVQTLSTPPFSFDENTIRKRGFSGRSAGGTCFGGNGSRTNRMQCSSLQRQVPHLP